MNFYYSYFDDICLFLKQTEVTSDDIDTNNRATMEWGCDWTKDAANFATTVGNKIIFIGNGGSAAIASHMATDWSKNGGLRSICFSDASALTCLSNDYSYADVYAEQIKWHGNKGDLLIAISSSGKSENIIKAVNIAKAKELMVVTLSGFDPHNRLRKLGRVNFYIPSYEYGCVEIGHLTILHAILDRTINEEITHNGKDD